MINIGDFLYCYNNICGSSYLTLGARYIIVDIDWTHNIYGILSIIDNNGYDFKLTICEDSSGLSYKNWFSLTITEIRKMKLSKIEKNI